MDPAAAAHEATEFRRCDAASENIKVILLHHICHIICSYGPSLRRGPDARYALTGDGAKVTSKVRLAGAFCGCLLVARTTPPSLNTTGIYVASRDCHSVCHCPPGLVHTLNKPGSRK